jgi:hypothetical protein
LPTCCGNAITNFHVSDTIANGDHCAGAFDSWRHRECVHRLGVTPPRPCIREVHARNGDINKSLSRARRWQLDVIKFHYFGAAVARMTIAFIVFILLFVIVALDTE